MSVQESIDTIKQIRKNYNKKSGIFYGFNERFDEQMKKKWAKERKHESKMEAKTQP